MIRVGVIRGGLSGEYNISLKTGGNVISSIINSNLRDKYIPYDVFIDKDGIIRYYSIQDSFFSRSVKESLRIIDIFQHSQKHQNELCPANWEKGGETINPTTESVSKFLNKI